MSIHKNIDKASTDLLKPVGFGWKYNLWMKFLSILLIVCLYGYLIQLREGLAVTGLNDSVSWGIYISNFVFFVACSLIGMLITAVMGLAGVKWAAPLSRISEIIAFAFAAVAGLVIVSDMGRPERLINVFMFGRVQSPILWDVTVVTTYVVISGLLLYIPMIPDIKHCYENKENVPRPVRFLYKILSVNWKGTKEQRNLIRSSVKTLMIIIVPVALAIHTVTSWLFASTHRTGWDSTIFGPYFVTGAFVCGAAAVIIAMFVFRNSYNLKDYITNLHFDKMGKLLVLVSLVYLYFNINEFLVPAYKLKKFDAIHIHELFEGRYAILFYAVQILGLIAPIIILLFKKGRRPLPMLLISIFVILGAWFKRYIILVPTESHPFLPIQNVPMSFEIYTPTAVEIAITIAPIVLVLMIISVLSKIFPVIPIHEVPLNKEEDN